MHNVFIITAMNHPMTRLMTPRTLIFTFGTRNPLRIESFPNDSQCDLSPKKMTPWQPYSYRLRPLIRPLKYLVKVGQAFIIKSLVLEGRRAI